MHATTEPPSVGLSAKLGGFRRLCGIVGVGAAVLAIFCGLSNQAEFFHAYLFAALICLNLVLGCLQLAFIHRITGGGWGHMLAPAFSSGQRMLPWTLLFCVPLFFGLGHLFPWATPGTPGGQSQSLLHPFYFSRPVFVLRAVSYAVLLLVLLRMAQRPDDGSWIGPVGMIVYVITAYLLCVDWILSLEPRWHSTGFPLILMASQALSALSFSIAATILARPGSAAETDEPAIWKDLGNLLLGALLFWAYVSYSQFIVVWSGNLPDQAAWYLHRNAGGWHFLLIALAMFQLFAPVLLLLSNCTKRRTRFFAALASGVLLCQTLYLYWLVLPSFRPDGIGLHWLDVLLPLTLGGLWLFCFLGVGPAREEESHV